MTEYWKSQSRKFCEFCKCWFADNKVSISFHENGKRHKESVQKHISQLSKKSAKEFKQKEKMDDDIKKMEAAAMAAYLKDVQNNADLTSQSINDMLVKNGDNKNELTTASSSTAPSRAPVWHEVKGDDGNSYYWNTVTNETTWDTPDEYLSIAQQEEKKLKKEKAKEKAKKQKNKEKMKEVNAHMAREKMKELAAKPEPRAPPELGPALPHKPYGSWTAVTIEPVESIDLQLPKLEKEKPPPVVLQPETVQFKEKRVESLGDGPVEFKKRKFANPKRNMRQKLDDE
ncbi:WW domain-binding protein 4 isoform X2 [Plodia interpunctella]|uniref:WW domain-binding protein 4 isoform X2 n=1 Tax=Plodia interpunctella TaxID=58824 RepID=UPI0023677937|nr:WW domain-binding protein 4 isoform X2 [Plodia interpunctella]